MSNIWTITESIETVTPPIGIVPFFTRRTWTGRNPQGTFVAGSQSFDDCHAQTLSNFQSRQSGETFVLQVNTLAPFTIGPPSAPDPTVLPIIP